MLCAPRDASAGTYHRHCSQTCRKAQLDLDRKGDSTAHIAIGFPAPIHTTFLAGFPYIGNGHDNTPLIERDSAMALTSTALEQIAIADHGPASIPHWMISSCACTLAARRLSVADKLREGPLRNWEFDSLAYCELPDDLQLLHEVIIEELVDAPDYTYSYSPEQASPALLAMACPDMFIRCVVFCPQVQTRIRAT